MKYIVSFSFFLLLFFCKAQTTTKPPANVQKSGTTTTTKTSSSNIKTVSSNTKTIAKKFSFLGSYIMKFTAKNTKGMITTGEIKSVYDEFKMASIPVFSSEKETIVRSIFDLKENTMTMMIDDIKKKKKSGMIMKMPKVTIPTDKPETTALTATIQKTTETKIIDGYKCVKWIIKYSDGANCESWICKDITINSAEAISYFIAGRKGKKSPINIECANINACAMESTYKAKDGSSVFMKITDIKKGKPDIALFSTNGYQLADVTGIEFFK